MSHIPLKSAAFIVLTMFGLMAGFFYVFSVTVMGGLDDSSASTAIEAMQGINRVVRNPAFFVTFFLSPCLALVVAIAAFAVGERKVAAILVLAAAAYFLGVVLPTATVNVPMNNALAVVNFEKVADQASLRREYSGRRTFWNTLRTGFSTLALIFSGLALVVFRKASKA